MFVLCFSLSVCAHSGRGGSRTLDLVLIRDLLSTTELRAAAIAGKSQRSGAEGSRTLTFPLKRRKRCRYATTPNVEWAYAFESRASCQRRSSVLKGFCSVVILRIELSATWISAGFGQPALDYQFASRDGRNRTDTIVCPKHAGLPLPNIPIHFLDSVARMGVEPISPP